MQEERTAVISPDLLQGFRDIIAVVGFPFIVCELPPLIEVAAS